MLLSYDIQNVVHLSLLFICVEMLIAYHHFCVQEKKCYI